VVSFSSLSSLNAIESGISKPMKYESRAYSKNSSIMKRSSNIILHNVKCTYVIAMLVSLFLLAIYHSKAPLSSQLRSNSSTSTAHFGGSPHEGYFSAEKANTKKNEFRFAMVSDLDQLSRVETSKKPLFKSMLMPGTLTYDPVKNAYSMKQHTVRYLESAHNEAGRGMELSELTLFQNRLLAFEDRTGIVFEILSKDKGADSYAVPRFIISEGDGDTDKGMKWEWATVKDDELYIGSMGKEYTNPDGSIANTNNLWVAIVSKTGEIRKKDWSKEYNFVRSALGASSPGYVIHEAVLWSQHLKKWVFLPRRVSSEAYDENLDEKKGSNKLVLVDANFSKKPDVVEIKLANVDPLHGFSTFAFVPKTNDRHAIAIRSVEENCVGGDDQICKQRSYVLVFDILSGEVLMDETKINEEVKFEGIEFVDLYTAKA